jgi:hypothetical protein
MKKLLNAMVGSVILSAISATASAQVDHDIATLLDDINVALREQGVGYEAVLIEYVTADAEGAGNTVFFKDVGNQRLESDFVPFDLRRAAWSGPVDGASDDITYAVDTTLDAVPPFGSATASETDGAIDRAMGTWDGVRCSGIPIVRNPDFGLDLGVAAYMEGSGGSENVVADIQHAGWGDIDWPYPILAATVTFWFTDDQGNYTDVDKNGRFDTAFREIYYDPSFPWAVHGVPNQDVDVETIALHESGHGLSQGHFGILSVNKGGRTKFVPRAVMNAALFAPRRMLTTTDIGGHCGLWGQWPQR